ncbi:DUF4245 domain-containing protein [Nocardioides xinjiangensis]|uniref:DUF4245 domain-containing protein n=1 Tax=Nocardioides xinjiangensis TaxID=2817376 RepID=UPI001B308472|nr:MULTISPECIES: DUF4245 domain-containing protein [unclassified Nocardioides]
MSAQPSRYNRSFGGMTGALVVTVVFVLAFALWRSLFRGEAEEPTQPVDWQESVRLAQDADLSVAHPRQLPDGWEASSVELRAGADPRWGLGVLTDDGDFIGIRQQDSSVADLVELYVDEEAEGGDEVSVDSEVARTWQTWTDDGGDTGYSTELGDEALLVYGSATAEEIEAYLGLLTR